MTKQKHRLTDHHATTCRVDSAAGGSAFWAPDTGEPNVKATDMIKRLAELVAEHGDIEVTHDLRAPVKHIAPYDGHGNGPTCKQFTGTVVEFYAH